MKKQIENGFPAFAGTKLSGTVAVEQSLLNDLLQEWLTATAQPKSPAPTSGVDLTSLRKLVKEASVRADQGVVMVDFKIAV